jgi:acyl-CoA synthetase (NDP forming)
MAANFQVMRTVVEHHGVLFADSLEEFGDLLEITSRCRITPSRGAAILTESGAFKALALDLCEQVGLPLPELDDAAAPELRAALPSFVPVSNPVDLTAQALVDLDLYRKAIACLLADDRFGCVVITIIQADATRQTLTSVINAVKQLELGKPVIFAGMDEGAIVPPDCIAELRALGVPYFPSAERAIRAIARVIAWAGRRTSRSCAVSPAPLGTTLPRGVIPEYRAKPLLEKLGIPGPQGRFAVSLDEAQQAAAEIGFPVALKAQAAELTHKSDVGGVILNLADAGELAAAWDRLQSNIVAVERGDGPRAGIGGSGRILGADEAENFY